LINYDMNTLFDLPIGNKLRSNIIIVTIIFILRASFNFPPRPPKSHVRHWLHASYLHSQAIGILPFGSK
jgi:hypothetical protein